MPIAPTDRPSTAHTTAEATSSAPRRFAAALRTIGIGVAAATAALALACALVRDASAGGDLVRFPDGYAQGVHYATVKRGAITEELFTSREAMEALRRGQPIPSGTVITMEDHREGRLFRTVVMEKRAGWGADYPPETRNGEWEFQAFNADGSVNRAEDLGRCFACHKSQAHQDFVFTADRLKTTP